MINKIGPKIDPFGTPTKIIKRSLNTKAIFVFFYCADRQRKVF